MNDELRAALLEAYPHISTDAFRVLCWHCGIAPQDVFQPIQQNELELEHEMV